MNGALYILPVYLDGLCRDNFAFACSLTGEISMASVEQRKGRKRFVQMEAEV
jgi:hypothetical protein